MPFSALQNRTLHFHILFSEKDRHGKPIAVTSYQLSDITLENALDVGNIKILTKSRIFRDLVEHSSNQVFFNKLNIIKILLLLNIIKYY